ncbi:MAG TPA: DUF308 domain-containing protein [Terrimicrobiaceae bacterium]
MSAEPLSDAKDEREYCRFGKRDLDGMSWLAPLLNNRVGDRLNLELRHEQLFFIQGDRVLDDVGYSEKGKRFSEAEFGKPIHSLDDLKRNGYWLVGREYDAAIMREALAGQKDGYYYSIFANQCQDWTDRLRRSAERLEAERGLDTQQYSQPTKSAAHYSKPVSPTEPASIWMGLLALALGIASIFGPMLAGDLFTVLVGVVLLVSGVSHIAYGLHAGDWRNFLHLLFLAMGLLVGGVLTLMNLRFAEVATGTLLGIVIAVQGVNSIVVGAGNRPLRRGLGLLAAGTAMLACAILILLRWPESSDASLGLWVGLALTAGGWSTIWLSWTTRHEDASPAPNEPSRKTQRAVAR